MDLYKSIDCVYLSESGYSFSSMEVLKRLVRMGMRNVSRSLTIAGFVAVDGAHGWTC